MEGESARLLESSFHSVVPLFPLLMIRAKQPGLAGGISAVVSAWAMAAAERMVLCAASAGDGRWRWRQRLLHRRA
jgi:hypothetical protein